VASTFIATITIAMKKIVLAFEGTHFSHGAFEFARRLNEKQPILLTGVFLPQVILSNLWSYADGANGPLFIPLVEDTDAQLVKDNIDQFESLCEKEGIDFRVHKDFYDFALPELKRETRYADLVILGSESFYHNIGSGQPNDYLKEALHEAECPVIVVPEKFDFPKANVLAYDGSKSSIFAIKQFSYLLPELSRNPTLLVQIEKDEDEQMRNLSYMEEWAARHFPDLTISKLQMDAKKYFSTWVAGRSSSILISGAYGRSALSQLFRKSFVSEVLQEHKVPVFVAH
jgi:nucleotide-binding universal stress UspA family protein